MYGKGRGKKNPRELVGEGKIIKSMRKKERKKKQERSVNVGRKIIEDKEKTMVMVKG